MTEPIDIEPLILRARMVVERKDDVAQAHVPERLEDIELTAEEIAENKAAAARFGAHLRLGNCTDPALASVNQTLMPGGAVLESEEQVRLPAELPAGLSEDRVVKTLTEPRVRYDFSVAVTRIELEEKLIEGSSLFRRSLAGRLVLDIVRTIRQTAVAAGVPVHEYLVSVLRADPEAIETNPGDFVPSAWAEKDDRQLNRSPGHREVPGASPFWRRVAGMREHA